MKTVVELRKLQMSKRIRKLYRIIRTFGSKLFHFNLFDICHCKVIFSRARLSAIVLERSFLATTNFSNGSSSFQSSRKLPLSSGDQCCVKSSVAIICRKGSSSLQSNINRCRCSGVQESERFVVNPCCSFSIPHSSKRLIISTFSSS